jgi:phospholipase/carboxylesterase
LADALNGPRLEAKSGKARQLVVFLHGYGADGKDLIEIGRQWRPWLPDAAFVAPNAPEPCGMAPTGRQWFPLSARRADEAANSADRWAGVTKAAPAVDAFLDAELAALGIDDSSLSLVGFSQGTMMALHVGLRRKRAPASILGYSGLLVGPQHLAEAGARDRRGQTPPILLIHGDQDQVIPLEAMLVASEDLAKADFPNQWHLSIGVGHGIDAGGLRHGGLFIAKGFGLKVA